MTNFFELLLTDREKAFQMRGLGSLVGSLVVVICLFRFWPMPTFDDSNSGDQVQLQRDEVIEIELIEPTVQNYSVPPAPPPPPQEVLLPPVEVEDTRIIEDAIQDLEIDIPVQNPVPNAPPAPPSTQGPTGPPSPPSPPPAEPTLVRNPDRSPVPVRFSEPNYPESARRDGVRARVRVEVLVDERGRVMETRVSERILIGRGDREERVSTLPHNLDGAAVDAARRYQFRPARHNGRAVQSYTTITCNFGV